MTPDSGQTVVAASALWQAEGETSVTDPFTVKSFYHLFDSLKKVFSLWTLENSCGMLGELVTGRIFPISSKCLLGKMKDELNSLEAPSA